MLVCDSPHPLLLFAHFFPHLQTFCASSTHLPERMLCVPLWLVVAPLFGHGQAVLGLCCLSFRILSSHSLWVALSHFPHLHTYLPYKTTCPLYVCVPFTISSSVYCHLLPTTFNCHPHACVATAMGWLLRLPSPYLLFYYPTPVIPGLACFCCTRTSRFHHHLPCLLCACSTFSHNLLVGFGTGLLTTLLFSHSMSLFILLLSLGRLCLLHTHYHHTAQVVLCLDSCGDRR